MDVVDQLRANYSIGRKSRKNWPRLAWWLIDMCIVNAYHLFVLETRSTCTQLEFRRALMRQLATAYKPQRAGRKRTHPAPVVIPAGPHYPKHSEEQRDCRHSSRGSESRKRGRVMCDRCNVHLCLDPCFREYHEAQ